MDDPRSPDRPALKLSAEEAYERCARMVEEYVSLDDWQWIAESPDRLKMLKRRLVEALRSMPDRDDELNLTPPTKEQRAQWSEVARSAGEKAQNIVSDDRGTRFAVLSDWAHSLTDDHDHVRTFKPAGINDDARFLVPGCVERLYRQMVGSLICAGDPWESVEIVSVSVCSAQVREMTWPLVTVVFRIPPRSSRKRR